MLHFYRIPGVVHTCVWTPVNHNWVACRSRRAPQDNRCKSRDKVWLEEGEEEEEEKKIVASWIDLDLDLDVQTLI
jgi:hypothetical protein